MTPEQPEQENDRKGADADVARRQEQFAQTQEQARQRAFLEAVIARYMRPASDGAPNPFGGVDASQFDIFQPVGQMPMQTADDGLARLSDMLNLGLLGRTAPTLPPAFEDTVQGAVQNLGPGAPLPTEPAAQVPGVQMAQLAQLMGLNPGAEAAVQQPGAPMQARVSAAPIIDRFPRNQMETAPMPPGFAATMDMANNPAPLPARGMPAPAMPDLSRFSMPTPVPRPMAPPEEGAVGRMGGPFRDFR